MRGEEESRASLDARWMFQLLKLKILLAEPSPPALESATLWGCLRRDGGLSQRALGIFCGCLAATVVGDLERELQGTLESPLSPARPPSPALRQAGVAQGDAVRGSVSVLVWSWEAGMAKDISQDDPRDPRPQQLLPVL